ncbi:MAG: carboxylesterase/lipase family protein [Myxococcales bacterium]|nr:carboxylesterase/lipase family protein [Myxococcales bacterium]
MSTVVHTAQGQVEGVREGELVVFKGIPYAEPPIGERRWLPPESTQPWQGVRPARQFGPAAHQNPIPLDILPAFTVGDSMSEDCLSLNVWTPGLDDAARPVLVWIHGGAFVLGSGAQSLYEGSVLARRGDVVIVTINYRLGPLGFMNLDALTDGRIPATGNEGLLDQVAALRWVRENIAGFGGNPENVTIFGESAGGMSIGCLLGLPEARGLFHKAIPQSGACGTSNSAERALRAAERVLAELGLARRDTDALRAATPAQLLEVQARMALLGQADPELGGMPFQPCVDGRVLPRIPIDSVRAGSAAGIPVLVGSTLEEWKLFGAADPSIFSLGEEELVTRLSENLEETDARRIIRCYREARTSRNDPVTPTELMLAIETDRIFRVPALQLAEAQHANRTPAYNYLYTWKSPSMGGMLGACHAIELGFVFGTIDSAGAREFSGAGPAADALERNTQDAWLAFARTGDPSHETLGKWPAYGEARHTMLLGESCGVEEAPFEAERASWDGVETAGRL